MARRLAALRLVARRLIALRLVALISTLVMTFALGGCQGSISGEIESTEKPIARVSLFEYIGDDAAAFAERFEEDFPVSVSVRHDTIASGYPYEVKDEETIRAVFEALKNMVVISDNGSAHTDDYLIYRFTTADGDQYSFEFQQGCYLGDGGGRLLGVEGFGALEAALSVPEG
jgi:hypothetical protein